MATLTCTNCGAAGPAADAFCTRCGMPRAGGPAPHAARGGSGSRAGMWIAIAAVGGFGGLVVIGILAAIAIPQFAGVSRSAKEAEAVPLLKHIHALEASFHERHGRFTANLGDPAAPDHLEGMEDPGAQSFTFSVSRATESELCIEAHPSELGRKSGLRPSSMDATGTRYAGPGCTGEPLAEAGPTDEETAAAEELTRDSEARPTLREIHRLETRFRELHGRFTGNLGTPGAPDYLSEWTAPETPFFTFAVSRATESELCVEARLTDEGRAAGLAESSMDQEGKHHLGPGCTGTVITSHGSDPAPEDEPAAAAEETDAES